MKKTISVILCLFLAFSIFALSSVDSIFPDLFPDEIDLLKTGESIEHRTFWDQKISDIAPVNCSLYSLALESETSDNCFADAVVKFIPYPAYMDGMTDEQKLVEIYNTLSAISTLKGITYISYSAGNEEKTLFSDAFVVKDKKSKTALADPVVTEVPPADSFLALITDTKFGSNRYRIDTSSKEDEVVLKITNVNTVKYLGIKCIEEEGLNMFVDVKLAQEGIVVYAMAAVYDRDPIVNVLVTKVNLPDAFMRRIRSLRDWFTEEIVQC